MSYKKRHLVQAVGVVLILVLVILAVHIEAERQVLPSWEVILTQPVASWRKAAEPHGEQAASDTQVVAVQTVAAAPQLSQATPPLRVAGRPLEEGTPTDQRGALAPELSVQLEERMAGFSSAAPTAAGVSSDTQEPSEVAKTRGESAAIKEKSRDPAVAETELAAVLATGGDLVRQGVRLPRLVATWNLDLLEELIAQGYGYVIAEWGGQLYRVVPRKGRLFAAEEFVPLTPEVRAEISNRGLALNPNWHGQSRKDTALRSAFRALEQRLQEGVGSGLRDETPLFTFFASGAFDTYLARKQLGALAAVGLDLHDPTVAAQAVATVGTIVLAAGRPAYLIREVVVGQEERPWQDPEAVIVGRGILLTMCCLHREASLWQDPEAVVVGRGA